jgi:hypothetical protein
MSFTLSRLGVGIILCVTAFSTIFAQVSSGSVPAETQEAGERQAPPATRMEQLRGLREERRKEITPPPPEALPQKYLKRFDQKGSQSLDDVNFWGFYPRLDWIARGSGAAPGVRYWKPEILGPLDVMASAFYSWRRYQHYDFQFGLIPNQGSRIPVRKFETEGIEELGDFRLEKFNRFKLYSNLRWRDRTDESFYGSGPDSQGDDRARYRVKDALAEVVTGFQFTRRVGYTFRLGFLGHSLSDPRSDPPVQDQFPLIVLPGLLNPPNYLVLRHALLFDFRDHPGVPHKGFSVAFGWDKYDNTSGVNRFNFNRFAADIRGFIPITSRQQVIALRGFFVNSDPASANRIPFFLQPSLGGGESLRAFDAYRFQGDKLMLLQGEYRWEASRLFELALFGDTGTVANQGHHIDLDKLKSDFGIGFRIKTTESTLFRFDIARGNEGIRYQFRFSPVF